MKKLQWETLPKEKFARDKFDKISSRGGEKNPDHMYIDYSHGYAL